MHETCTYQSLIYHDRIYTKHPSIHTHDIANISEGTHDFVAEARDFIGGVLKRLVVQINQLKTTSPSSSVVSSSSSSSFLPSSTLSSSTSAAVPIELVGAHHGTDSERLLSGLKKQESIIRDMLGSEGSALEDENEAGNKCRQCRLTQKRVDKKISEAEELLAKSVAILQTTRSVDLCRYKKSKR